MLVLSKQGQDTNRVRTFINVAELLGQSNPPSSIIYCDSAINLSEKLSYRHGIAMGCQDKGLALQQEGKYEEALKSYREGIDKVKPLGASKGLGMLYHYAAYALIHLGKNGEAIPNFQKAEEIFFNTKQFALESDAFRGEGTAFAKLGEYEKAATCFDHARDAAEKANDKQRIGFSDIMLGNTYQAESDYDKALEYFEKSAVVLKEINSDYGLAGAYISIGNIYYFKKNKPDAKKYYQMCFDLREKQNDKVGMAQAKDDIANVIMEEGNYSEALKDYNEGLILFRSVGDSSSVAESLENIGALFLQMKDYQKSETALLTSLDLSNRFGFYEWKKDAYASLAKLYAATGKFEKAYLYKDSLMIVKDSLMDEDKISQSKEIEAKYENRKNEAQITHLNELNAEKDEVQQKQKQIIIYVSAGLGIVLLLSFFLVQLNAQRKKANLRLADQNKIIAEKNKDITDSINYASRIQKSVMPDEKILKENVDDYFIFNRPRDIVSGDFYWLAHKGDRTYIAAADCTGHGVPGALVSVIGINMLNKVIEQNGIFSPAEMIEQLHMLVISALNKDASARESKDGMDMGLLCIDKKNKTVLFASAGRPLYYNTTGKLEVIKASRYSIAGEKKAEEKFSETEIQLQPGMSFYLSSDGYVDQFGEASGKKFLSKRFQELLAEIFSAPMKEQGRRVEEAFMNWKGKVEQVDDVMVIGVKI